MATSKDTIKTLSQADKAALNCEMLISALVAKGTLTLAEIQTAADAANPDGLLRRQAIRLDGQGRVYHADVQSVDAGE